MLTEEKNALIYRKGNQILRIEGWGTNALRVRATENPDFSAHIGALNPDTERKASVSTDKDGGTIINGKISARVSSNGIITFFRDNKRILHEYHRYYDAEATRECRSLKILSREFKGLSGNDWKLAVRFEPNDGEHLFGMGQYQQPYMDLKGCTIELSQRNGQITIPFVISSLGYGFFWNLPSTGHAVFGRNLTEWTSDDCEEMDYWITADDTPAALIRNYTEQTGRTPVINDELLGLWQCKLRYRTQDEVLEVARKYHELEIKIPVIVIDFFHWPYQGSWCFDKKYWPDVKAMCDELHSYGTKVMVSVWPSVDKRGENFEKLQNLGYLERTQRGASETYDYLGDCSSIDVFNPGAREWLWKRCKEQYRDLGIDYFWLDNAEPDYAVYDYENFRFYSGPAQKVGNEYPKLYAKTFYDGLKSEGEDGFISLIRCAWAGSQKYGVLVWSGDIPSTFEGFRDQISCGINMGIAGIPLWTSDIGGFMTDDVSDPAFQELLIRWYETAVFSPILRMHGDRGPYDIPPVDPEDNRDWGGGYQHTGQPNEIWSYGEKNFAIMKKFLKIREKLIPYIHDLIEESHNDGSPIIRGLFYEFPDDEKCWNISDEYMLGDSYLVAPILKQGATSREVYLPEGQWKSYFGDSVYSGGRTISVDAPIDELPVFIRTR